jgi:hypothetical protein
MEKRVFTWLGVFVFVGVFSMVALCIPCSAATLTINLGTVPSAAVFSALNGINLDGSQLTVDLLFTSLAWSSTDPEPLMAEIFIDTNTTSGQFGTTSEPGYYVDADLSPLSYPPYVGYLMIPPCGGCTNRIFILYGDLYLDPAQVAGLYFSIPLPTISGGVITSAILETSQAPPPPVEEPSTRILILAALAPMGLCIRRLRRPPSQRGHLTA